MKKDGTGSAAGRWSSPRTPTFWRRVSQMAKGGRALVVGFAAETDDVIANATAKRARKGCDWIVANDVSPATGIMGGSENAVTLISDDGRRGLAAHDQGSRSRHGWPRKIAEALG